MREHQIAISLKPQQFELLQRLARERGFKSVTAYVKQKIVELALGIDADLPAVDPLAAGGNSLSSAENQALLEDLSRIHQELKAFVGRSPEDLIAAGVSPYAVPMTFDLPPPGQVAPDPVSPKGDTKVNNFAVNPSDIPVQPGNSFAPASDGAVVSQPAAQAPSNQVLPSNNLGGFGFKLGGFTSGPAATRFQPPLENNDRLSGYREIMDDLEELADRAFAISPRLGALDEEVPAEPATGRGGRSEAIFVEPILPEQKIVGAKNKGQVAAPAVKPINMVPAISPADLPGPAEMPAEPQSSSPAASDAPAPDVVAAESDFPAASAAPAASVAPAASDAPTAVAAQPEPVNQPLPGDDLLSELLDESLIAHAQTPRPADNPFSTDLGFDKGATEYSGEVMDVSGGAPPFIDPEAGEEEQPALPAQAATLTSVSTSAAQEDLPLQAINQAPGKQALNNQAPNNQDEEETQIAEQKRPGRRREKNSTASAYNDADDNASGEDTSGPDWSKEEAPDQPPPGKSSLGAGPPPKRRRS